MANLSGLFQVGAAMGGALPRAQDEWSQAELDRLRLEQAKRGVNAEQALAKALASTDLGSYDLSYLPGGIPPQPQAPQLNAGPQPGPMPQGMPQGQIPRPVAGTAPGIPPGAPAIPGGPAANPPGGASPFAPGTAFQPQAQPAAQPQQPGGPGPQGFGRIYNAIQQANPGLDPATAYEAAQRYFELQGSTFDRQMRYREQDLNRQLRQDQFTAGWQNRFALAQQNSDERWKMLQFRQREIDSRGTAGGKAEDKVSSQRVRTLNAKARSIQSQINAEITKPGGGDQTKLANLQTQYTGVLNDIEAEQERQLGTVESRAAGSVPTGRPAAGGGPAASAPPSAGGAQPPVDAKSLPDGTTATDPSSGKGWVVKGGQWTPQ